MKVAVITGASNGIGFRTALKLAAGGVHVFAVARSRKNLEQLADEARSAGSVLTTLGGDLTEAGFIEEIVKEVSAKSRRLDMLINNAGLLVNKPFEELSESDWTEVYTVNVFAPVAAIRKFLPLLSSEDPGFKSHVVNISSMGGFQGSMKFKGLSAYSSSKSALAGVTECLAEELKEKNVAVNCLCLGSVQTEMFQKAFPGFTAATSPGEMAELVAWFAMHGQKFFNGKILPVSNSTP